MIYSDHHGLRAVFEKADIHDRLARWLDFVAEYEFQMKYVDSIRRLIVDYDSRCPGDSRSTEEGRELSKETFFNEQKQEGKVSMEPTPALTEEDDIKWFLQKPRIFIKSRNGVGILIRLR